MTLSRLTGLGAGGGLALSDRVEQALLVADEVGEATVLPPLFVTGAVRRRSFVHVFASAHRRVLHRIADPSAGMRESGVGRLRPTRVGILEFEVNAAESFAGRPVC